MKWKDVDGSDGVLRGTDVEDRMRKTTKKGQNKRFWGPRTWNPRTPSCEKEC